MYTFNILCFGHNVSEKCSKEAELVFGELIEYNKKINDLLFEAHGIYHGSAN